MPSTVFRMTKLWCITQAVDIFKMGKLTVAGKFCTTQTDAQEKIVCKGKTHVASKKNGASRISSQNETQY